MGSVMAAAQADPTINFVVTFGHRPAYSTGNPGGVAALATILDGLGDNYSKYVLDLNGHAHVYERYAPIHNVVHLTAGTGGSVESTWPTTDSRTAFRAHHLAHLRVDVTATSLHLEAVCGPTDHDDDVVCASGAVLDSLTINKPNVPVNAAPVVAAGPDASVVLPALASLAGSVSDDGLPQGNPVTSQWTQVSGPGTATFTNAANPATTVGFSTAGTYVLRLTATDGDLSAFDEVTIDVQPAVPVNAAPVVGAGPDGSVIRPALASLAGSVSDDGLPQGNPVTSQWTQVSGPGTATFTNAANPATTVGFSTAGTYVLRLTATDGDLSAFDEVTITASDPGPATLDRAVAASSDDAEESSVNNSVDLTSSDLELVTDGTVVQTVGLRFGAISIPRGATITNAYVQFETDETASAAASLVIRGQAADNATTFTNALANVSSRARTAAAVSWAPPAWPTIQVAGPAQRTPNLSPVITEITGRAGWTSGNALALILTGTGRRIAEAFNGTRAPVLHVEYTLSNGPVNAAPVVGAGPDGSVIRPALASLAGSVSDDGLPQGNPVTSQWTQVSGPGTATFTNAANPATTVGFSTAGTYVLRLTATDGDLSAFDEVTITASDPGPATLDRAVAASSDDAEESSVNNSVDLTSSDLELVTDGTVVQTVGLRFGAISIPRGATITNAYVQFETDETASAAASLVIRGQAADNATTFTNALANVSSRARTAAAVSWAPPAWPTIQVAGPAQRTPNLSPVITEITGRAGWTSGNALALILTGTGRRIAEAFNGTRAPVLHVEYTLS